MALLRARANVAGGKKEPGTLKTKKSGVTNDLYAALDLGTNSCRMLIARPDGLNFTIVDAFSKSVRLGSDLERTGVLSQAGVSRTLQALHVCARKIRKYGVSSMRLVATEACRRAKNGKYFLEKVNADTGLKLEIIEPSEEARLAIISCAPLLEPEVSQVLVVDIGGGSTELVWIDLTNVPSSDRVKAMMKMTPTTAKSKGFVKNSLNAKIIDWISVPLGVATLHQKYSDVDDDAARFALMSCYFEDQIVDFKPYLKNYATDQLDDFQIIGTSGTITTLGAAHLGLRRYDRYKVDGLNLTSRDVDNVINRFLALGPVGRKSEPGIGKDRSELIMSGSAIIQTLLRIWPTERMRVADRGLREGILYSLMIDDNVFDGSNHE